MYEGRWRGGPLGGVPIKASQESEMMNLIAGKSRARGADPTSSWFLAVTTCPTEALGSHREGRLDPI